jgi:uncharacterized membrane protein
MDLGVVHVAAATAALILGVVVLLRRKGNAAHVLLGRAYLAAMVVVNIPVFFLYNDTGRPGPFHVLAVVSVLTTLLGWVALRGAGRRRLEAHGSLMTWSWVGVATAGLAQAANREWPESSPWPVVAVVCFATVLGLILVPRFVARALERRAEGARPGRPAGSTPARAGCC